MADHLGLVCLEDTQLGVEVCFREDAHLLVRGRIPVLEDRVLAPGGEDERGPDTRHRRLVHAAGGGAHRAQPGGPVKVDGHAADVVHAPDDIVDALVAQQPAQPVRVERGDGVALDADEEGELGVRGALRLGLHEEGGVRLLEVKRGEVGLVSEQGT